MAQITKHQIMKILTGHLKLEAPEFRLEKAGPKIIGNVISPSFRGMRDHVRQKQIWEALESELGDEVVNKVGMILAFTPDEWNLGGEPAPARRLRKAG